MQNLPHHYAVNAKAASEGNVNLSGAGLSTIASAPPIEFGGPGDLWSPESLLVAAVADCFALSFRAIARGSRFDWISIDCDVVGILDKTDGITRFVDFTETVTLEIPQGADEKKAQRLLEMAEKACLITNSLSASVHLETNIVQR